MGPTLGFRFFVSMIFIVMADRRISYRSDSVQKNDLIVLKEERRRIFLPGCLISAMLDAVEVDLVTTGLSNSLEVRRLDIPR